MIACLLAAVLFNEVQSSNGDWIELYNTGTETENLFTWGLSDKGANPFKWQFPKGWCLAPGESRKLEAPFGISSSGETLYLTQPGCLTPSDQVTVPALPAGVSWGRVEGGAEWRYFTSPTPGAANTGSHYSETSPAPVVFSVQRGVFWSPFELTLSHPDPEVEIYYTLNHEEPMPETAIRYSGPLSIDKTTVVRARAVKPGAMSLRDVVTHTYIFPEDVPTQKRPDIAPTTWDDGGSRTARYTVRAAGWDAHSLTNLPIVSLTMPDKDLFDPKTGLYCKPQTYGDVERAASFEEFSDGVGCNAGVCIQGDSCRLFLFTGKKSFRVNFREKYGPKRYNGKAVLTFRGNRFDDWSGWTPSDGTYLKDELARRLQQDTSGYSAAGDFVHLFLNGLYWGVYNRCERPDAKMSERLFGGDADNYNTIKHYNQVSDGNGFEYRRLIANVSNLTYEEVCKAVDMPAYIDYLLVENVIGNREWPDNNFIVTHSPKDGIKCHFFAWDCETAYDAMSVNYVTKVPSDKESSPQNLHVALMQHEEYRREYSRHARKHLLEPGGSLTVEAITNHIVELAAILRAPLRGESSRWGTDALMEGYDGVVGQLLGNAVKRHATFVAQLQSAGLLLPDVSTDGLVELDPMVPMDPVVVPERPTTRVDEITAGFLGATLQEGVSQSRKFAGPLKASRVNLYLPTTVGGETWYGGIVATDLPSTEKCHVYLVDGTELGAGEYYLYNKLDLGDGRKTYYVVMPSRPGSTLDDVWTWTGGPLPPLMFQDSKKGADDKFIVGEDAVHLCVHTLLGLNYMIEGGPTLNRSDWTRWPAVPGTGLPMKFTAPRYGNSGFYRVLVEIPER